MNNLNYIFPSYFLMLMDKRGLKITEGFDYDDKSTGWANK